MAKQPNRPKPGKSRKGNFDKFIEGKKVNPKAEKKNDRRKEKEMFKKELELKKRSPLVGEGPIRIIRFIAMAGVCSRREADDLIAAGRIKVNGKVVTELGMKVDPSKDTVMFDKGVLKLKNFVYLLMNKPKNHITTTKDDKGRRTVMELVKKYTKVRIVPVGRLDRNTTGLLLFTNDGDLAAKLTHPSNKVTKIYYVRLDKEVAEEHLEAFLNGVELEDGLMKVDTVEYLDGLPTQVVIEIHSGRNRIVRRLFEHFGYSVESLDRVKLGPLSKKGIPRGTCRMLTEKEVGWLKMLGSGK